MATTTEKMINIESACGGILILTNESAGGVYGVMGEIEEFANIGRLELFYIRGGQLVVGREDENAVTIVAYVDYI